MLIDKNLHAIMNKCITKIRREKEKEHERQN